MKRLSMLVTAVVFAAACGSKTPESGTTPPGDDAPPDESGTEGGEAAEGTEEGTEGTEGGDSQALTADTEERVKARVQALRTACLGDRSAVVGMLLYRGDDLERRWKEPRKPSDPDTKRTVDQTCAHLTGEQELRFGRMEAEEESEGVWNVIFVYGAKGQASFAFLEVDGELLLGDVDN